MLTKTNFALAAVVVFGFAGASAASDNNSGDYHGGFVIPGSTDGVNPAYHPDWFLNPGIGSKVYGYANGGRACGFEKGGEAYGYSNGGDAHAFANGQTTSGQSSNGNFIPRGTFPAQVPSHHEED